MGKKIIVGILVILISIAFFVVNNKAEISGEVINENETGKMAGRLISTQPSYQTGNMTFLQLLELQIQKNFL